MDLTQNWALKHGFLHACNHRPKTPTESNQTESNRIKTESKRLDTARITL
jgi:hypothetical protein